MTIQQLHYVITISEMGSLNKASEVLYVTQPSLTSAVQELEKELGIVIFNRGGKGVTLTSDGAEFLQLARQVATQYDRLLDKYGKNGNLMTRDVISREMEACGHDVFLDISFLDRKTIDSRLGEVRDLCMKYGNLDITRSPIPVAPSVHFFMGGLAVHLNHETNLRNLFAVGECASMYHGANRLGGNSLLSAIYSANVAADEISGRSSDADSHDFTEEINDRQKKLDEKLASQSRFPSVYVRNMLSDTMRRNLGIVREEGSLGKGIGELDYYISVADQIRYDSSVNPYDNYSLNGILALARATLECALLRKESRGSHFRSDYPETDDSQAFSSLISYDGGKYTVHPDKEFFYES